MLTIQEFVIGAKKFKSQLLAISAAGNLRSNEHQYHKDKFYSYFLECPLTYNSRTGQVLFSMMNL